MTTKKRKPWLAAILSLFSPALGYAYAGNIFKGIMISSLFLLMPPFIYLFLIINITPTILVITIGSFVFLTIYIIIDSYQVAKKGSANYIIKKYNNIPSYILIYLIFGLLLPSLSQGYTRENLVKAYKIPAASMIPTLMVGDHVLVDRKIYKNNKIQYKDIIVFPQPNKQNIEYVKRVIALPGDKIEIINKEVYINSQKNESNYAVNLDSRTFERAATPRDNFGPILVPNNSVFVMGDNRDNSFDSRFFGVVPIEGIKGKLSKIYWSWDSSKHSVRWNRIGKTIK